MVSVCVIVGHSVRVEVREQFVQVGSPYVEPGNPIQAVWHGSKHLSLDSHLASPEVNLENSEVIVASSWLFGHRCVLRKPKYPVASPCWPTAFPG